MAPIRWPASPIRPQEIIDSSTPLEEMVPEPASCEPARGIEMAISQQVGSRLDHYVLHDDYLRAHQEAENQALAAMWNAHPPATMPDPLGEMEAAINEQMQVMSSQLAEPEPFPPEEDPWQEQQQEDDEDMMRLMNPFGMMGPGPMM